MVKELIDETLKTAFKARSIDKPFACLGDIEEVTDLSRPTIRRHMRDMDGYEIIVKGNTGLIVRR